MNRYTKTIKLLQNSVEDNDLKKLLFDDSGVKLIVCYISPYLNFKDITHKIKLFFGDKTTVLATSTAGELCSFDLDKSQKNIYLDAYNSWESLVIQSYSANMLQSAEILTIDLECEDIKNDNENISVSKRTKKIIDNINQLNIQTNINYQDTLAFTIIDGLSKSESFFIDAIYQTGRFQCQLIGGSSGGKLDFKESLLFNNNTIVSNVAIIVLMKLRKNIKFGILKSQNFKQLKVSFKVLDCSITHRYVQTVLNKKTNSSINIIDYLVQMFNCAQNELEQKLLNFTFGIVINNEPFIRSISKIDYITKRVYFYCDVDFGDELYLFKSTDFVKQTQNDYDKFLINKPHKPFSGIMNDCILRRISNSDQLAKLDCFNDIYLSGFSTFGELLGVNINQTLTAVFFFEVTQNDDFSDDYMDNFIDNYSNFKLFFNERKLNNLQTQEIQNLHINLEKKLAEKTLYLESFFHNKGIGILVVDSIRTNIKVNDFLCEIFGYTQDEILGENALLFHISKEAYVQFGKMAFEKAKNGEPIEIEYQLKKKNGDIFWVLFNGEFFQNGDVLWLIKDISAMKNMQQQLKNRQEFINSIMNIQESIIVTSDGRKLKSINQSFKDFYNVNDIEQFEKEYGSCIGDTFEDNAGYEYITKEMDGVLWVDYLLNNRTRSNKVIIKKDKSLHIFSIDVGEFMFENKKIETVVLNDITALETAKKEIEFIHKQTRDSIKYASLIQGAVISRESDIRPYFKDTFVHWEPKDTVGGDIWLFNPLRHKDECLLFYIDCTGHGVAGAFVTMIVKAIEREITVKINEDKDMDISPAWIMSYFNKTMKILLKQISKDSISNAGLDGGIIYYNRKKQILKFTGAETSLYYITNDGEFKTIKGDRYSVGYKQCAIKHNYQETTIEVKEGMKFYCTTDGYIDQNGGEKGFPFGKKRFSNIIKNNYKIPVSKQKKIFIDEIKKYESMVVQNDRNDDITLIAFEIGAFNKSEKV